MKLSEITGGQPHAIVEGFLNNFGQSLAMRAKAATMLPRHLAKDNRIQHLIDVARNADTTVIAPAMDYWWRGLARFYQEEYPDHKDWMAEVMSSARMAADAEGKRVTDQYNRAVQADVNASDYRNAESDLRHGQAMHDLRKKYGNASGMADAEKKKRAYTIAKLLDISDDNLDPETVLELIGRLQSIRKMFGGNRKRKKTATKKESIDGLRTAIVEGLWDAIKRGGANLMQLMSQDGRAQSSKHTLEKGMKYYLAAYAIKSVEDALQRYFQKASVTKGEKFNRPPAQQPVQQRNSGNPQRGPSGPQRSRSPLGPRTRA